jgi:Putative auto-transporter adhesin, head GIN domain
LADLVLSSVKHSTTKQQRNISKMKKIKKMALLSVVIAGLVGCNKTIVGEGPVVAENRSISKFGGIDLHIKAELCYQPGNNLSLEVTAQQNILDNLQTIVVDDRLVIQYIPGKTIGPGETVRINITAPGINSFSLYTAGDIYCPGSIQATNLLVRNNGSGTISLKNVVAKNLEVENTSSGSVIALDGTAANEIAKNSGIGKIDLSGVQARTAKVLATGSGKIQVKVADHLHATIEGSGPVYYSGYPDVSSHISGTGHLVHL